MRLGTEVSLSLPRPAESVRVATPDGQHHTPTAAGRNITITADQVGVYRITADRSELAFAANALCYDESDLKDCRSGRWGGWVSREALRREFTSVSWVLILAAMLALAAHAGLIAARRREAGR